MKICHISTVHDPFDTRIFHKECVSMTQAGFEVNLVITHDKSETINGVNIVPLKKSRGRIHRIFIKTTVAFFKALKTKSKIFHLHDPELILVGLGLRLFGKKVVYDMHELVYHQINDKKWIGNRAIRKTVGYIYKLFESIGVRCFNKVVLAEDGYKSYFEKYYSKRLNKIIFIRNYPRFELIKAAKKPKVKSEKTILLYAGGLTKIRGIKEVCDAVKGIDKPVEIQLFGKWENEEYRRLCLEGNDKVTDFGLVPLTEVYEYMHQCDIGLSTLYFVENYMTSLPVKSFEYMICSLPMIMSEFPYWKDVYVDCALFVNPESVEDISKKIKWAIEHPNEMAEYGVNGFKRANELYNWELEAERLKQCYAQL
jgi:glycosyltransferase involved in cell wall biosynthesis